MYSNVTNSEAKAYRASGFLLHKSSQYLAPVLLLLQHQIDKRLARTFYDLFMVLLIYRNRAMGLLLSELGGYICGFAHAPAGTKRVSNLLRSQKWASELIDNQLFNNCKARVVTFLQAGKRPLIIWDDKRDRKSRKLVL